MLAWRFDSRHQFNNINGQVAVGGEKPHRVASLLENTFSKVQETTPIAFCYLGAYTVIITIDVDAIGQQHEHI
ncbi:MAG: hypothetical protein NVS4B7_08660 [Ktedonobacteraceae bacterium]